MSKSFTEKWVTRFTKRQVNNWNSSKLSLNSAPHLNYIHLDLHLFFFSPLFLIFSTTNFGNINFCLESRRKFFLPIKVVKKAYLIIKILYFIFFSKANISLFIFPFLKELMSLSAFFKDLNWMYYLLLCIYCHQPSKALTNLFISVQLLYLCDPPDDYINMHAYVCLYLCTYKHLYTHVHTYIHTYIDRYQIQICAFMYLQTNIFKSFWLHLKKKRCQ